MKNTWATRARKAALCRRNVQRWRELSRLSPIYGALFIARRFIAGRRAGSNCPRCEPRRMHPASAVVEQAHSLPPAVSGCKPDPQSLPSLGPSLVLQNVLCALALGLLSACIPVARPAVKIGLVGPFEGRYRDTGYAVIYGVRLAVREANQHGLSGYGLELMSLDDSGDPAMAAVQAQKLATDPQMVGAVGHWLDETTVAAAPVYAREGLPLLATTPSPQLDPALFRVWPAQSALDALVQPTWKRASLPFQPGWGQTPLWSDGGSRFYLLAPAPMPADSSDPSFAERYRALSNGVEPNAYSVLAYDAARLLCDAIARDVKAHGKPTRAGVAAALRESHYTGLSGAFSFDSSHAWAEAKGWVYSFEEGRVVKP